MPSPMAPHGEQCWAVSRELLAQGFAGETTAVVETASEPSAQLGHGGCRYLQELGLATLHFAGVFSASKAATQLWFTLADAALN